MMKMSFLKEKVIVKCEYTNIYASSQEDIASYHIVRERAFTQFQKACLRRNTQDSLCI